MRAVVIGLAETGLAVNRRLRAEGWDVTILEDSPARRRTRARRCPAPAPDLVEAPAGDPPEP